MRETVNAQIMAHILASDFGNLGLVKHHKDRNDAAKDTFTQYLNALFMAQSAFLKGTIDPDTEYQLEWPNRLNVAVLGEDKTMSLKGTQGSRQLSELVNVIWSMALNGILSARNEKLTPRADIIINYIKTALIHVVKVKPTSTVCIRVSKFKENNKIAKFGLYTTLIGIKSFFIFGGTLSNHTEYQLEWPNSLNVTVLGEDKTLSLKCISKLGELQNQKAIMAHLSGLQLSTKFSNLSFDVIQTSPNDKPFTPLCNLDIQHPGLQVCHQRRAVQGKEVELNQNKLHSPYP